MNGQVVWDCIKNLKEVLLKDYWWNAEEIFFKFNEYGIDTEEKEEKVYESLEGISQLLKIGSFSFETCQGFINEAIFEYWKYKTDFEDILMELFFDSNKFDEILEFLIKS